MSDLEFEDIVNILGSVAYKLRSSSRDWQTWTSPNSAQPSGVELVEWSGW